MEDRYSKDHKEGLLIALEGLDGAGTSTQLAFLTTYARMQGRQVYSTAEPSKGQVGQLLRSTLHSKAPLDEATLALLFAADRLDHLEREVLPQLHQGSLVLTDRYLLSSYAYQGCTLPLNWILSINAQARAPDATFFLRISPQTAAQRRQVRGGSRDHFENTERQEKVAQMYEEALALPQIGRVYQVDAEASRENVTSQLCVLLEGIVRGRLT